MPRACVCWWFHGEASQATPLPGAGEGGHSCGGFLLLCFLPRHKCGKRLAGTAVCSSAVLENMVVWQQLGGNKEYYYFAFCSGVLKIVGSPAEQTGGRNNSNYQMHVPVKQILISPPRKVLVVQNVCSDNKKLQICLLIGRSPVKKSQKS